VLAQDDVEWAIAAAAACGSGGRPRLIGPAEAIVEARGAGQTQRLVHHLLPPSAEAERLIIVEVYTPGGNWSSFPPHKHDTDDRPRESQLEELYYYHLDPPTGFAVQRVYTADGSLDQSLAATDGDLVLVPRGYHVVGATPGHECYYLNVMAGQGRLWAFTLDPAYAHLMNWSKPPGT
jgi:5-deoxy-glucuronate isomerase